MITEKLESKQQQFIDAVMAGQNVFLSGQAGTGKTFITKLAKKMLEKEGKKVAALAPTGVAANNLGGQTMHSFFSLPVAGVASFETCNWMKGEKRRLIQNCDVFIFDEISMIRPDLLDAVAWTMAKNNIGSFAKKQIIFVGDLKQLPAPIDDNFKSVMLTKYKGEEFFNASIYGALNCVEIFLDKVIRQSDPEFIAALNVVRDGGRAPYFAQFLTKEPKGIIIAPHKSTVQGYNVRGLAEQTGELYTYIAKITGGAKGDDFNLDSEINVKDGCSIMYLKNSLAHNDLINGTLGIFRIKEGEPYIEVRGNFYQIEEAEFEKKEYVLNYLTDEIELQTIGSIKQMPIRLAYAMTIHKSQGLTFDEVTVDLTLKCFSKGQQYVALSRVRTPGGLRIIADR